MVTILNKLVSFFEGQYGVKFTREKASFTYYQILEDTVNRLEVGVIGDLNYFSINGEIMRYASFLFEDEKLTFYNQLKQMTGVYKIEEGLKSESI